MPSASAPSKLAEKANPDRALCGAKTRRGTSCRKSAGAGTDHPGFGHCRNHGGCTPNGEVFAARLEASSLAIEYGVEPHEALLRAVGQAARWELYCREKVAALEADGTDLTVERTVVRQTATGTVVERSNDSRLHIWVKAHVQAVRDLASISKTAIDAGVEERRVRVAEALGGQLADVLGAIFNELELTAEQRRLAQPVVRRHLVALEGGERAA